MSSNTETPVVETPVVGTPVVETPVVETNNALSAFNGTTLTAEHPLLELLTRNPIIPLDLQELNWLGISGEIRVHQITGLPVESLKKSQNGNGGLCLDNLAVALTRQLNSLRETPTTFLKRNSEKSTPQEEKAVLLSNILNMVLLIMDHKLHLRDVISKAEKAAHNTAKMRQYAAAALEQRRIDALNGLSEEALIEMAAGN